MKHQLDIGLPLSELWNLYIDPNATPMVKNFCIVYIEMAFERVQIEVCFIIFEHLYDSFFYVHMDSRILLERIES